MINSVRKDIWINSYPIFLWLALEPIVGLTAENLHQRTPFVFGSKEEVETIKKFYEDPKSAHAPLFRTRGLFNR